MLTKITNLQETVDRLHARLQQATRAMYALHASGNDQMALIALSRVEILNTRIAELNALMDQFDAEDAARVDEPAHEMTTIVPIIEQHDVACKDVIIDDPDQDDIEIESRGTMYTILLLIILAALAVVFLPNILSKNLPTNDNIKQSTQLSAVDTALPAATPIPDVTIKTADISTVTYIVQEGDTLWSIATTQLGDGSAWGTVYGQNVDIIGDNADLIFPGQVLTITKVSVGSESIG